MSKKQTTGGFVYSTNPNFKLDDSPEQELNTLDPAQQDLRVWLEKNHRGGKTASVVKGFVGSAGDLEDLGKKIKQKCGTGGSAKDGEIIIQGDHRDKIIQMLVDWGYKAKKAGG